MRLSRHGQLRAITLYYQVIDSCEMVCNFVKAQDATIYSDPGVNRMLEVRKLRESLVARKRYGRASVFMQLELTLVQGLEMQASVGAAIGLCNVMSQSQNQILFFHAAKLSRQLSGILLNIIPQIGEQLASKATLLLEQIFPHWEDECPAISFDHATSLIRGSASAEGEKYNKFMDLSVSARERKDLTRANQALLNAREAAQKHWIQSKQNAALQDLQNFHTSYIDLHRDETGIAFFESAGINGYLTLLFVHKKDYQGVLQNFEAFQNSHTDFEIPTHQERRLDMAIKAARALGMEDLLQRYTAQHFEWLKQCSFSEQGGNLKESAMSDPDQYIRQISTGARDPVEWGNNALALIMALIKLEWKKGLLSTGTMCNLLRFAFESDIVEDTDTLEEFLDGLDFEDAAQSLYGSLDKPTPSARFVDTMQSLKEWLSLPDRLPSRVSRLDIAKIIMQSRMYRIRLHLASKGLPDDVDMSEYADEQQLLDEIEELENNAGGGWGNYSERQKASKIQLSLNKCYVQEAATTGLRRAKDIQSRIQDCAELASNYADGGRRFFQYHTLCQQSRLYWQRYLHFRCVPPDAGLEALEQAEQLFNEIRKQMLNEDPAQSFTGTIALTEEFISQEHSKMALAATLQSFWGKMAAAQESKSPEPSRFEIALEAYDRFLKWTYQSKDRVLIDLIIRKQFQKSSGEGKDPATLGKDVVLSSSFKDLDISDEKTLKDKRKQTTLPSEEVYQLELSKLELDERIVSKAMINQMLNEVEDNVVLVDIINLAYLARGGSQACLYRNGTPNILPIPLPDLTIETVEAWVLKNFGTSENSFKEPLVEHDNVSALEELTPLLMPLFNAEIPQYIKQNEVIIFCLTGELHRVPVHAIPINGIPLIERNPVGYCSSLTTLYQGFQAVSKVQPSSSSVESLAIVPSYKEPWTKDAEAETHLRQQVEQISAELNAEYLGGSSLTKKNVQASLSKRAHFYYFGHVHYDPKSHLRSALLFNDAALKEPPLSSSGSESLTVRDLFSFALQKPALVTLIGCASGRSFISSSDDVLGLPSAFLYAGASAVVSTLWPISADDGAEFAANFYRAFHRRQQHQEHQEQQAASTGIKDQGDILTEAYAVGKLSDLKKCVNLALVMQDAVKTLRQREKRKQAAYHWAGFYLTGFWLFPPLSWDNKGQGESSPNATEVTAI